MCSSDLNAAAVLELLKNNLIELAERELVGGTGTGKYTSAHKQGKYIEFRSAGGDWLAEANAEPGKLENTMMRYAYAMYLAGNPGSGTCTPQIGGDKNWFVGVS